MIFFTQGVYDMFDLPFTTVLEFSDVDIFVKDSTNKIQIYHFSHLN